MSASITAVIPTYNVEGYLAGAIQSVLGQTRPPDQIVIVDDCSTDDTLAVARAFADPRIVVRSTPVNSGSGAARNIGIKIATGDYVAMLDGDDYWLPDHLNVVGGLLDRHASATLAFTPTEAFGAESYVWPIRVPCDRPVDCFWQCVPRTIIPHMNVLVRRDALREVGGYRETLRQSQDYDLFLRLAFGRQFVCTSRVTTRYRRHEGSITTRQPWNAMRFMYLSRHLFLRELPPGPDAAKFAARCREMWVKALNDSVDRQNWRCMDFHLGQAEYVAGADSMLIGWKLRRAVGTLQWMWEVANRPLRAA